MKYTFTGKIIKVGSIIPCTGKVKEKVTFIVRDEDDDNREIAFLLFDESIELYLTPLEIGDRVKVTFTIKSREFINKGINTGDYSTNCFALHVEKIEDKKKNTGKDRYRSREDNNEGKSKFWEEFGKKQNTYSNYGPFTPPPWEEQTKSYTDWFIGCKSAQEAKKRYRELSKLHHPDMPGGTKETFQIISNQYERWK